MKNNFGYNLRLKNIVDDEGINKYITLPYADDYCLITTNKRTHQKVINEIDNNINSMGMQLKPSKSRSFSLSSGSSKVVDFFIGENCVPSISEEEQKFLGRVIFYTGKSQKQ